MIEINNPNGDWIMRTFLFRLIHTNRVCVNLLVHADDYNLALDKMKYWISKSNYHISSGSWGNYTTGTGEIPFFVDYEKTL